MLLFHGEIELRICSRYPTVCSPKGCGSVESLKHRYVPWYVVAFSLDGGGEGTSTHGRDNGRFDSLPVAP